MTNKRTNNAISKSKLNEQKHEIETEQTIIKKQKHKFFGEFDPGSG